MGKDQERIYEIIEDTNFEIAIYGGQRVSSEWTNMSGNQARHFLTTTRGKILLKIARLDFKQEGKVLTWLEGNREEEKGEGSPCPGVRP